MDRTANLSARLLWGAMCASMAATPLAFAQDLGTCPDADGLFAAYDVASVKPVHPDSILSTAVFHHPNGIDGESVTVEMIVRSSYAYTYGTGTAAFLNEDVIAGLPAWAKNDTFSLQAKMSLSNWRCLPNWTQASSGRARTTWSKPCSQTASS